MKRLTKTCCILTIQESLELTRDLWLWLALNPGSDKSEWPEWEKHGKFYAYCPCCEYAKGLYRAPDCSECPLKKYWAPCEFVNLIFGGYKPRCMRPGSPYLSWVNADNDYDRMRSAISIVVICNAALENLGGTR